MANELAHVGRYVLQNADAKFAKFKSEPPRKLNKKKNTLTYDKKKGRDFWTSTDENGNVNAFGHKAPAAICADGAPESVAGDTYQATTSFQFTDGSQINADEIPYVVLPRESIGKDKNGNTIWASPDRAKGTPFYNAGIQRGDYVRITNPANGKTAYAIYGENGPSGQVGEISMAAARELGINPSPISGGFTNMTDSQYLNYEFFPGSGKRSENGSRIQKQTKEEITKNGRIAAGGRSISGGFVIASGNETVLVGPARMPAAFADPLCIHEGGCPLAFGSDSVFIAGRPTVRVGDACTCGFKVVSGDETVFVFGNSTSEGTSPPPTAPFSPFGMSLPAAQSPFSPIDLSAPPAWAKDALGPSASGSPFTLQPLTGVDLLNASAGRLFQ